MKFLPSSARRTKYFLLRIWQLWFTRSQHTLSHMCCCAPANPFMTVSTAVPQWPGLQLCMNIWFPFALGGSHYPNRTSCCWFDLNHFTFQRKEIKQVYTCSLRDQLLCSGQSKTGGQKDSYAPSITCYVPSVFFPSFLSWLNLGGSGHTRLP